MAGKEGKLVLGRCTAGQKAATRDETSTKPTLRGCTAHHKSATGGERCTTEPMEVSREDALLKRKAEEEIYPHPDQEEQEKAKPILMAAIHHKGPDVVSVAAAGEATETKAAVPQPFSEGGNKEAVSEHQAEVCIMEAVYEPHGEDVDDYEDEAEDDYEDDAEYDDDAEDDYDYEGEYDYEPYFEEQRPKVRAVLQSFPEAADLDSNQLDAAVERILEQSKPENADLASPGKIRLLRDDIDVALNPWTPPPPSILRVWFPNDNLSADSIRRHEELDKEFLPLYGKSDEEREREEFRAKVRRELIKKGCVEVDEDYYDKKDEHERQMMQKIQEEWNQKTCLRRSNKE